MGGLLPRAVSRPQGRFKEADSNKHDLLIPQEVGEVHSLLRHGLTIGEAIQLVEGKYRSDRALEEWVRYAEIKPPAPDKESQFILWANQVQMAAAVRDGTAKGQRPELVARKIAASYLGRILPGYETWIDAGSAEHLFLAAIERAVEEAPALLVKYEGFQLFWDGQAESIPGLNEDPAE